MQAKGAATFNSSVQHRAGHRHCGASACLNGNGNGRIEPGSPGALHEDILAWHHWTAAGLITGEYRMLDPTETAPTPDSSPANVFGGYLQIVTDSSWSYGSTTAVRNNVKTGNLIPVAVLAELDRRIDDGLPRCGRLQFSTYAGLADAPTAIDCVSWVSWNVGSGAGNCGAGMLLY